MKIIIIRHGDPDYEHDSLTEKGWREAGFLSDLVAEMDVTKVYVSPLGRAKDTAGVSLQKIHQFIQAVRTALQRLVQTFL